MKRILFLSCFAMMTLGVMSQSNGLGHVGAHSALTPAIRDSMMDCFLRQYYHKAPVGHVLGKGGWWGDAEMIETILDAFETTGDKKYGDVFRELYVNFISRNGTNWAYNEYNDDITWMVLACVRAYKFFGDKEYLDMARGNFDAMYARALQKYGTLIWKQTQDNKLSTNSCINCPATIAACYLAEAVGDKSYYDKALSLYSAQRKLLFNPSDGHVFDSRAWNEDGTMASDFNRWASTYNQGTMLGAAVLLYQHTGNKQYATDANRIYDYAIAHLCGSDSIVKVCQTISGDLSGFKGILMRYARLYANAFHRDDVLCWIGKNAMKAWQNRNSNGVTWSAWLTKTSDTLRRKEGNRELDVSDDAFGASTAVSAAFNADIKD